MNANNGGGGALRYDCPWYVPRREDALVFAHLMQGQSVYVQTLHQMGKSSLLVRLVDHFRKTGLSAAVAVDLSAFGSALSQAQWYGALTLRIGQQLGLEQAVECFWETQSQLAPFERFAAALKEIVLPKLGKPLIVFIDELDLLRSLPFSTDELLLVIHTAAQRTPSPRPGNLNFCLFGTVCPTALWAEGRHREWTLGQRVSLDDFTREELISSIEGLVRCVLEKAQLPERAWVDAISAVLEQIFARVYYWTSGHPYLTQRLACAAACAISQQLIHGTHVTDMYCRPFVDHLCETLFIGEAAREQDCHILWVRQELLRCGWPPSRLGEFLIGMRQGQGDRVVAGSELQRLLNSGLVRARDGRLGWRNRIYERALTIPWVCHTIQGSIHGLHPSFSDEPDDEQANRISGLPVTARFAVPARGLGFGRS